MCTAIGWLTRTLGCSDPTDAPVVAAFRRGFARLLARARERDPARQSVVRLPWLPSFTMFMAKLRGPAGLRGPGADLQLLALAALMGAFGVRPGQAAATRRSDVEPYEGGLRLRTTVTKTDQLGRPRFWYMAHLGGARCELTSCPTCLLQAWIRRHDAVADSGERLFPVAFARKHRAFSAALTGWAAEIAALPAARLPAAFRVPDDRARYVPHGLRAGCACALMAAGASLQFTQEWVGWASATAAERYVALRPPVWRQWRPDDGHPAHVAALLQRLEPL